MWVAQMVTLLKCIIFSVSHLAARQCMHTHQTSFPTCFGRHFSCSDFNVCHQMSVCSFEQYVLSESLLHVCKNKTPYPYIVCAICFQKREIVVTHQGTFWVVCIFSGFCHAISGNGKVHVYPCELLAHNLRWDKGPIVLKLFLKSVQTML